MVTQLVLLLHESLNVTPEWTSRLGKQRHVAQEVETVTGARQSHADTVGSAKETGRSVVIVPH